MPTYSQRATVAAAASRKIRKRSELLMELADEGTQRNLALAKARKHRATIRRLAREAIGAGATLTDIATAAGITRVTLNKMLDEKPGPARLKK